MKRLFYILLILPCLAFSQTIDNSEKINNLLYVNISNIQDKFLYYNYDTSTVWFTDLGFDIDSLPQYAPDTLNIQWNGMCFLDRYQPGIEYVLLEAAEAHPVAANLSISNYSNYMHLNGWVLIREEPPLFVSMRLIRELIDLYN